MNDEDKFHLERQVRKKPCKRKVNPSKEKWKDFEIRQVLSSYNSNIFKMNVDKISRFIFHNIPCRKTGQTFEDRYNPSSQQGHGITGIKFIIEQAIRGYCKVYNKTEHGFKNFNPALRELFESGEIFDIAQDWVYRLALERINNSEITIDELRIRLRDYDRKVHS